MVPRQPICRGLYVNAFDVDSHQVCALTFYFVLTVYRSIQGHLNGTLRTEDQRRRTLLIVSDLQDARLRVVKLDMEC